MGVLFAWSEVNGDLGVNVKVGSQWVDIDQAENFTYNQNWGHWTDAGFQGYWFTLSSTTDVQLYSKANGIKLDYRLVFQNINETTITAMSPTQGPDIIASKTGGAGFTYPTFNNNPSVTYEAVAQDLKVYVKPVQSKDVD